MALPLLFFGTGAALMRLQQRARESDECYDYDHGKEEQVPEVVGAAKAGTSWVAEGGGGGGGGGGGKDEDEECVACPAVDEHEEACCRFCFASTDKARLISPCACTGSQQFVHTRCLRQWQKIVMRTKGNREVTCRVCHALYRLPARPVVCELKLWFSLKARDRLNAYSRVWLQSLFQLWCTVAASKKSPDANADAGAGTPSSSSASSSSAAVLGMRRSSSAHRELALMLASTEVRIWVGREVRHGRGNRIMMPALGLVKSLAWFGSAVNALKKLDGALCKLKAGGVI